MVEGMDPQQVKYMTDKIPMKRYCASLFVLLTSIVKLL
jgi:hypothetical protein